MPGDWGFYATAIGICSLLLLMLGMEKRGGFSARQVSTVAVLAAFCAAGRAVTGVAMLFLQPTMFLVEIAGFVMGGRAGFLVGALTPLISNFFMGQGPWTPWQMLCWGMVGFSGAVLKKFVPAAGNYHLTVVCFLWGYLYGAIMDIWHWSVFVQPLTLKSYFLVWLAGFSFDSLRAAGNLLFCLAFGAKALKILDRYQKRMSVSYLPEKG